MRLTYRPFQAVVLALLAALVTAAAAFAPLYDRAMQQALTDLQVASVTPAELGLTIQGVDSALGGGGDDRPPPPEQVLAAVPASLRTAYETPVPGYAGTADVVAGDATRKATGRLLWRDGQCRHVVVVSGRCPEGAGEIGVSEADATTLGLAPGARVVIAGDPAIGETDSRLRLRVTGVVRQRPAPDFWAGQTLTGLSGTADPDSATLVQHDVWLTGRGTFEGEETVPDLATSVRLVLDPDTVDVDELLRLGAAVSRLAQTLRVRVDGPPLALTSALPPLAQEVRRQTAQSRVTVPLLMAQLVLLSVVVLWLVLLAVTEQRRPEVAVARLRGRGRRGATAYLLGELAPVVLAGVVPGALLAVLAAAVARRLLPGRAPFELGWSYAAAVGLSLLVLTAATLVAALRVAREPLEVLLRRVPPRRSGWGLGVADAILVAGSGGVVLGFLTGGLDGPVALAAPGLLAVVVGLVLAHLATPTAAALGRRLLARGRLRAGLAVLDAARSPATRRVVTVITLATALAVFTGDAVLVGQRNRVSAAEQEAGAPAVVRVSGEDLPALRAAVAAVSAEAADGPGRVTPVVRSLPAGSDVGGALAVEPATFARVALLPPGGAAALARLRAPDVEPVRVTGTRVVVDVDDSSLVARRTDGERTSITVGLDLVLRGQVLHATLGTLAGATDSAAEHVRLGGAVACREGCVVVGLWLGTLPGAEIEGAATLSALRVPDSPDASAGSIFGGSVSLGTADRWTSDPGTDPDGPGAFVASDAGPGLHVDVESRGSATVTLPSAWAPSRVGAVVSPPAAAPRSGGRFTTTGLDDEEQDAVRVASVSRVPGGRPGTVLVDLDVVDRTRTAGAAAGLEVWCASADPGLLDDVREALEQRGLGVDSVVTLARVRRLYDASTAAWSLQLALLVGVAALLLAALVLVVGAASSWRQRARDLAALRMGGVPRRDVTAIVVLAQLPAVVGGLLAGCAAGLLGARLALPLVPLFASAPAVSTLDLATAWSGVLVAAGVAAGVLLATAVGVGRGLARRSGVRRLRETL